MVLSANGYEVRAQLFRATPPQLNHVPVAMIWAEVMLTKEQYERQLPLATAFYMVQAVNYRIFVGTKGITDDKSSAYFYWFVSWVDPAAGEPDFWTMNASQEELLEYARRKTAGIHPRFLELINLTNAEGVLHPPIKLRDWVPDDIPRGRVTLLGDAVHPMTFCGLLYSGTEI